MRSHVLVVDDSFTVRSDLRALLNGAGFLVTACLNLASARSALRSRPYALAILDVVLPDGSGIDLLRDIRLEPELSRMPVIVLSTESEAKDRIRGFKTGADEYMAKPYDREHLVKCVQFLTHAAEASAAPSERSSERPSERRAIRKKILVVDDSPTYAGALVESLSADGYHAIPALSGEDALEILAVERIDAVILDMLMPGMGGLETCRRIRADHRLHGLPVMMLTGREDSAARREGLAAGVDEFVIKSPALELVRVRLRSLLRSGRTDRPSRPPSELEPTSGRSAWRDQTEVPHGSLLYRIATATGLTDVIGPATLSSACRRAGVDVGTTSPAELDRALPSIGNALRMFLSSEEIERRLAALRVLAGTGRRFPAVAIASR